jgi:integrase
MESPMAEHLTKRDGFWRFVRRVPKELADLDKRVSVQVSTHIRVTDDPRAIRASQKARELDAVLERQWHDLANGVDSAKAQLEYDAAVKAAKRFGLSEPIDDPTQRSVPELLARIEKLEALLADRTVSDDHKRAAALAAYDAAPKPAITFRECAEQYIELHKAGWKNAKHAAQWETTLRDYAYPIIGIMPVNSIDGNGTGTDLMMKILEPIWRTKVETAARVRGRIESVLNWAKTKDYRSGENPARWKGHLENLLPAKSNVAPTQHHAALPYGEMPEFFKRLRDVESKAARCLEFTILTACRSDESLRAQRSEIDLKTRMWTIPASRTKTKKEHRVPLSDSAVAIIEALPDSDGYLFPSTRKKATPLNGKAMSDILKLMSLSVTVHGFRSTFDDWAHETTSYPNHVVEMALAHKISNKVEAAYRRGDLLQKRQALMADWDKFCSGS